MSQDLAPASGKSHLEDKLSTLEAIYQRFGRDGLAKHSLVDVNLLLASKELQFRDAPKGRDLPEDQKVANRKLELEIKDIHGLMHSQLAGAGIQGYRQPRQQPQPEQQQQQAQSKIFDKSR